MAQLSELQRLSSGFVRVAGAAVALSAMAVLAGCSPSHDDLPVFDRDQQPSDMPPAFVELPDTIHEDSLRHIGEDSTGTDYYAAESDDPQGRHVCLTVVASATDWSTGCTDFLPIRVTIQSGLEATLEHDASGGDEQVGGVVSVVRPPA